MPDSHFRNFFFSVKFATVSHCMSAEVGWWPIFLWSPTFWNTDVFKIGEIRMWASSLLSATILWVRYFQFRWLSKHLINKVVISAYVGCPESIQPFWISREPVAWPWCNLAGGQRRPYCTTVKSHCPVGLVIRQWDAVDYACILCDRRTQQWTSEQISFITTMRLPILQLSCRLFWQGITSTKSISPPTAQIRLPATSGFSQI
jgi:hypothetical protein